MNKSAIIVACLMFGAGSVSAEVPDIRSGLWQYKINFETESGKLEQAMATMKEQMANMPPEQREMVRNMMKKKGVGMDFTNQTFSRCVSEEEASQKSYEVGESASECEETVNERSDNKVELKFSCPGNPPREGEGEITYHSDRHYSGIFNFTTQMEGKPERVKMTQEGKWQGNDCGDLKP